jgi:hypothetical protein
MGKESPFNLFRRLEQPNGLGAVLSRERDILRRLENIWEAAKAITGAEGFDFAGTRAFDARTG